MLNLIAAASLAVALSAVPALAQNNNQVDVGGGKGLVVVDVSNVDVEALRGADINVLNDLTAQVPINVAAILCNTEVNVIASSNTRGNKSCTAAPEGVTAFLSR